MRVALLVAALISFATTLAANRIELENALPGTKEWQISSLAREREIEGYASATSVNIGGNIRIFVNTNDPTYTIEIFRMGWYGGLGGRRMLSAITLIGTQQPMPDRDLTTGLIECHWLDPFLLAVPSDWTSGIYLAKLTAGASGKQIYVIFVVRDDARASDFLFQSSVITFQAYNNWGGKSLYPHSSPGGQARKVSFDRPYDVHHGLGTGAFLNNGGWEYNLVRWLERNGYDVTYCTDIDTHRSPSLLRFHKAFLSVGHDEYWTWQMRQNVEAARDAGVNLGFFGANACYWQIRLETNSAGEPDRTIVGYKEWARFEDPYALDGNPMNDHLVTTQWRLPPVLRPEAMMIGQMYVYDGVNADLVVEKAGHWVFAGSGAVNGDRVRSVMGYEVDEMSPFSPPNTQRLAHSPFVQRDGVTNYADTTIYAVPSGAIVFASGSIQWSWGLDDYNVPDGRTSRLSPVIERMTRNVLDRFAQSSMPLPPRRRAAGG